ncbi:MAG TPA: alpha/beta hydrolase [Solirubrobacterales bacterium]|nr:alpha/beta hydrolase [Solirubrobacterales bacterium]
MDFTAPKTADSNAITMEFFEQGEGTPVLLLHGFPEHPFSWRNQVDTIAEAGFRVIVPSQRGYAGTDAPADAETYSVKNLVADVSGLLDALGIEKAVWFGHDWGSMPAWYGAVFDPDRVLGVGSLCTPYFTWESPQDMIETYDELRGPNHYMRTFQEPGVGEGILGKDVEHTFRSMLRGRGYTMDEFEAAPKEVQEVPAGVFVGDPQLFGEPIVSEQELAFYVDVYTRSGFTGGLNWYRALRKDFEEAQGSQYVIDKPALLITAEDDWFFPRGSSDGLEQLLPQLEKHVIPNAAHWLQQEKPDEVNALLVPWLQRNFAG